MTTAQASRRAQQPRPDLRFLFHIEDVTARHTSPLLTLRADIAQWVAVNRDGTVRTVADEHRGIPPGGHELRNCSWTSRWDGLAGEWDPFTLTAQAHGPDGWYGWHAGFRQPFAVDLLRAQAMVKVLRRLDGRLHSLSAQYGQPSGVAEWAARIYAATGGSSGRRSAATSAAWVTTWTATAGSGWTPTNCAAGSMASWPPSARLMAWAAGRTGEGPRRGSPGSGCAR